MYLLHGYFDFSNAVVGETYYILKTRTNDGGMFVKDIESFKFDEVKGNELVQHIHAKPSEIFVEGAIILKGTGADYLTSKVIHNSDVFVVLKSEVIEAIDQEDEFMGQLLGEDRDALYTYQIGRASCRERV